jgi:ubiquitin-conjugating enzyme E2 O
MDESPPRFEVDDTVILHGTFISDAEKRPPSLIGRVERTYHALDSHEPLEDCLIIAYVPIDPAILLHFSTTGRPPKGYLFVQFMHEECGYALLPEGSVLLISRAVALGDTVKQDTGSAMFGTVVDVDSSYILSPICRLNKNPGSDVQELEFVDWTTTVQSPGGRWSIEKLEEWATEAAPSGLVLQKSKTDDLKSAHDFQVGDHVVYRDWAGVVELTDTDVAILLDNQTGKLSHSLLYTLCDSNNSQRRSSGTRLWRASGITRVLLGLPNAHFV